MCQSLRQYVFVHKAILEGALRMVDEEATREQELGNEMKEELPKPEAAFAEKPKVVRPTHIDLPPPVAPKTLDLLSRLSGSVAADSEQNGKRRATPTELVKTNSGGEVSVSKRPSIRRGTRGEPNPGDDNSPLRLSQLK
jgi:hypothetical protein